jgi:hypothetical protein
MPTTITGSTGVSQVQDGVVDADALATLTKPLGVGQTWQNATASRTAGVTYTNTTGRPIQVVVNATLSSSTATLTVNGVVVSVSGFNTTGTGFLSAIVPAGNTYVFAGVVASWVELR